MRIAIAGSHGVGKTTLAKALSEKLRYPRIGEVARTVAATMGFETTEQIMAADKEQICQYQQKVFYCQLLTEEAYQKDHGCFISDRSIFDVVSYMGLYQLEEAFINDFALMAGRHSRDYDLIIYCPVPNAGITDDGFRLVDKPSQIAFDAILKELLETGAQCPVIYLPPTRETWLDKVLQLEQIKKLVA